MLLKITVTPDETDSKEEMLDIISEHVSEYTDSNVLASCEIVDSAVIHSTKDAFEITASFDTKKITSDPYVSMINGVQEASMDMSYAMAAILKGYFNYLVEMGMRTVGPDDVKVTSEPTLIPEEDDEEDIDNEFHINIIGPMTGEKTPLPIDHQYSVVLDIEDPESKENKIKVTCSLDGYPYSDLRDHAQKFTQDIENFWCEVLDSHGEKEDGYAASWKENYNSEKIPDEVKESCINHSHHHGCECPHHKDHNSNINKDYKNPEKKFKKYLKDLDKKQLREIASHLFDINDSLIKSFELMKKNLNKGFEKENFKKMYKIADAVCSEDDD